MRILLKLITRFILPFRYNTLPKWKYMCLGIFRVQGNFIYIIGYLSITYIFIFNIFTLWQSFGIRAGRPLNDSIDKLYHAFN